MKPKKLFHRRGNLPCDEIEPDDGVDPRTFFRKPSRKRTNRKALQLCGQIAQTLSSLLAWESGDELLRSLSVEAAEPAPDSTRVLVTVSVPANVGDVNRGRVLEHLHRATGMLRTEVAAAIHRKRVPELIFHVVRRGEVSP
jgi:ribosome-binding factor A